MRRSNPSKLTKSRRARLKKYQTKIKKYSKFEFQFQINFFFSDCQEYDQVRFRYKGCFKDNTNNRDLPYDMKNFQPAVIISIDQCVSSCSEKYFRYAGLQNGTKCFCGNSYGRYGPEKCNVSIEVVAFKPITVPCKKTRLFAFSLIKWPISLS